MPFPYRSTGELPEAVRNALPEHAQEIFMKAGNAAWEKYRDPKERRDPKESREEVAYKIAWAAVEQVYEKDPVSGTWKKKIR
jgi:cation transport regulator